jgi:hypothetical protein
MDQTQVAQRFESNVKRNTNRFVLILIGGLASLMVFRAVITRWQAFDSWTKVDAIIFLLLLVAAPWLDILADKRSPERRGLFRGLIFAYLLTILAIMLFAKH